VETAIQKYGFFPPTKKRSFPSYQEVIIFLKKEIVKSWKESGRELPKNVDLRRSLELSSIEILKKFLDRVEKELLPAQKWEHAENLLANMLTIPKIQSNPILIDQIAKLLKETRESAQRAREERLSLVQPENLIHHNFPRISKIYRVNCIIGHSRRIKEQGQILSF
jgi:hypothetical protein